MSGDLSSLRADEGSLRTQLGEAHDEVAAKQGELEDAQRLLRELQPEETDTADTPLEEVLASLDVDARARVVEMIDRGDTNGAELELYSFASGHGRIEEAVLEIFRQNEEG
jgi:hypothetical protein